MSSFLRLSSLRLCHCTARIDALQSLVDAVPALAAIHLESVTITQQRHSESFSDYYIYDDNGPPPSTETVQLCCPAATVLVLGRCHWKVKVRPWPHQDTEHVILVNVLGVTIVSFRAIGSVLYSGREKPSTWQYKGIRVRSEYYSIHTHV
jgi:hypothetical protein